MEFYLRCGLAINSGISYANFPQIISDVRKSLVDVTKSLIVVFLVVIYFTRQSSLN